MAIALHCAAGPKEYNLLRSYNLRASRRRSFGLANTFSRWAVIKSIRQSMNEETHHMVWDSDTVLIPDASQSIHFIGQMEADGGMGKIYFG